MVRPWIKLWTETLSDPKIARLPDWQWRRFIEFLMLAGFNDADGKLPPVDTMGWMLRLAPEKVEQALHQLSEGVGVIRQQNDGSWLVVNFAKRQETDAAKRMRKMREKKRNSYGNSYGTDSDSDSDSISDLNKDLEKIQPRFPPYSNMPAVVVFTELAGHPRNKTQAKNIADKVGDIALWRKTLEHWLMHGWKTQNAAGVLQLYERGGPDFCETCAFGKPKPSKNGNGKNGNQPARVLIENDDVSFYG